MAITRLSGPDPEACMFGRCSSNTNRRLGPNGAKTDADSEHTFSSVKSAAQSLLEAYMDRLLMATKNNFQYNPQD